MEYLKKIIPIFFVSADFYQSCLGCGEIIDRGGNGRYIRSPNYGAEYGKIANCSWQFNSINSGYALQLKLAVLRMYYYDVNGDKQCGDSYRLRINGGHGKQKARTTPPKNHSQVTYVYDVTAEKMQVADSKWGVDATSLMMGAGLAAVVTVIVLLIWCFVRKKRRENSNVNTQSGDEMPTRQDSKKVEYVNVTATTSKSVYNEVTMATQRQSSRATTSESLKRPMDNYDDIILVEMPGYQAVEFGPEQDEGGYVAPMVHGLGNMEQ